MVLNDTVQFLTVEPQNLQNLAGWPRVSLFAGVVAILLFQKFLKHRQWVKYHMKGLFPVKVPQSFTELPSYPVVGPLLHLLWNRNGYTVVL